MVKFGKNKFKALNKIAKGQKSAINNPGASNRILKKINAEKKVSFQKEVLMKEAVAGGDNALVKNIKATELILKESKKVGRKNGNRKIEQPKPKTKPVEKRKKRQKTQISDTKLMLSLMKKKVG